MTARSQDAKSTIYNITERIATNLMFKRLETANNWNSSLDKVSKQLLKIDSLLSKPNFLSMS